MVILLGWVFLMSKVLEVGVSYERGTPADLSDFTQFHTWWVALVASTRCSSAACKSATTSACPRSVAIYEYSGTLSVLNNLTGIYEIPIGFRRSHFPLEQLTLQACNHTSNTVTC